MLDDLSRLLVAVAWVLLAILAGAGLAGIAVLIAWGLA
jgi:hypothetical protein